MPRATPSGAIMPTDRVEMNRLGFAGWMAVAAMLVGVLPVAAQTAGGNAEPAKAAYAQSSRPRIIITPRRLGPNAKRYCRSRLVQEYRVSGTVIVPRTTCWWQ